MCGIVGISAETNVAAEIYDSLLMLQHRGQDAAGISVCNNDDQLNSRKSMGYVRDVFQQRHMEKLVGNYGIGHVRYPTAGGAGKEFAQPMYVNSPYGISLVHNGNLTNSKQLGNEIDAKLQTAVSSLSEYSIISVHKLLDLIVPIFF